MKNHFARIGRAADADEPTPSALASAEASAPEPPAPEDAVAAEDLEAAREILGDTERERHYRRLHVQYRAMAEALDVLDAPGALDSYSWRERLVEFSPEEEPDRIG